MTIILAAFICFFKISGFFPDERFQAALRYLKGRDVVLRLTIAPQKQRQLVVAMATTRVENGNFSHDFGKANGDIEPGVKAKKQRSRIRWTIGLVVR